MIHRRDLLKGALATAAATLAAPATVRAANARVLKFVPQADLAVLDPAFTAYVTRHHALMVFDTLYGVDENLNPVPQMLEGAVQENGGLLWRFTLRPGLMFHDGEPVRATDCVASIRRWAGADAVAGTMFAQVDEMAPQDDRTFIIRLKRPFPLLPNVFAKLSSPVLVIMPERIANTPVTTRITDMIGSGPFRYKAAERVPGAMNVYERFADYKPRDTGKPSWTSGPKVAHFDRVEWITMTDAATIAGAIQRGEIDWWEYAATDLMPLLKGNSGVQSALTSSLGFMGTMLPNPLHPPFDNPAIRRLLLSIFNQDDFMTAVCGTDPAMWRGSTGIYTPNTPFASKAGMDGRIASDNIPALKKALVDAGYKGEKVVLLGASDLQIIKSMSDVADDALRKVGFNVDYQLTDWGTMLTRRQKRDPVDQGGWSLAPTGVDGAEQVTPLTHRYIRGIGPTAAIGWVRSADIETLWSEFAFETDEAKRNTLAAQIQAQVFKDVPSIPLGQYMQPTALRSDLTGRLDGMTLFWNLRRNA